MAENYDEAIREYINPVHTGNSRIDAQDAVRAIRRAGGIPYGRIRWEVREKMLRRRKLSGGSWRF